MIDRFRTLRHAWSAVFCAVIVVAIAIYWLARPAPLRHPLHRTLANLAQIKAGFENYRQQYGKYPAPNSWREQLRLIGFPQDPKFLRDAWGFDVVYEPVTTHGTIHPRIYSVGPNGRNEGGRGDDVLPN